MSSVECDVQKPFRSKSVTKWHAACACCGHACVAHAALCCVAVIMSSHPPPLPTPLSLRDQHAARYGVAAVHDTRVMMEREVREGMERVREKEGERRGNRADTHT